MMKDNSPQEKAASRRQFLQSASLVGGALVLGHAVKAQAADGDAPATAETVVKLGEHEKLKDVGGFDILEIGDEKVIIAHTETGYAACSAICPHKGCEVVYHPADKQFFCPCHKSAFAEDGKLLKGPARVGLAAYTTEQALLLKGQ